MAWLHNVNMSYLFEKMETYKKYYTDRYNGDPSTFLENWIRFTINPVTGANEEFHLRYEENSRDPKIIDVSEVAELLGVSQDKVREWAYGFLYYKTPVVREGKKYRFVKDDLLEWAKTPTFIKLKEDYLKSSALYAERKKSTEARREAERLAKEEKKLKRENKANGT